MRQLPSWIEEEAEDLRPLIIELHVLRHRGVRSLRHGEGQMPLLEDVVRKVNPEKASASQYQRMSYLVGSVIVSRLADERDRQAVAAYFGTASGADVATEAKRREKAARYFDQSFSTFREPSRGEERLLLVRVATLLHAFIDVPTSSVGSALQPSTDYVRRGKIHAEFESAVKQGSQAIVFMGEPGNGVNRVAREALKEHVRARGESFIELDARAAELVESVHLMLLGAGVELQAHDEQTPTYRLLAKFLMSHHAPGFLLLRELDDVAVLRKIVGVKCATKIVATSYQRFEVQGAARISVDSMRLDEADALLRKVLPDIGEYEIRHIAGIAEFKPGFMRLVAEVFFQKDPSLPVLDMHRAVNSNLAATLNVMSQPYMALVAASLDQMRVITPAAFELLEYLSILDGPIRKTFLARLVATLHNINNGGEEILGAPLASRLCKQLEDHHLIANFDSFIRINRSVQSSVRQSMSDTERLTICSRLRLLLLSEVRACRDANLGNSLPDFVASAGGYLSHLLDVEMAGKQEAENQSEVPRRVAKLVHGVVGSFEFGEIGSLSCASDSGIVFENLVLLKSTFFIEDRSREHGDGLELEA